MTGRCARGAMREWRLSRGSQKIVLLLAVVLLCAHVGVSVWECAGLFYRRAQFTAWWRRASATDRAVYLYSPSRADLTAYCLNAIRPAETVLIRTDGEPWLLNYYLYPRALFMETVSPPASDAIGPPSSRQKKFGPRTDFDVRWIIEDYARGPGVPRDQRAIRTAQ